MKERIAYRFHATAGFAHFCLLGCIILLLNSCGCGGLEEYVNDPVPRNLFLPGNTVIQFVNEAGETISIYIDTLQCTSHEPTESNNECRSFIYQTCGQGYQTIGQSPHEIDHTIMRSNTEIRVVFNHCYYKTGIKNITQVADIATIDSVIVQSQTHYGIYIMPMLSRESDEPNDTLYFEEEIGPLKLKKANGGWWERVL